MTTPFEPPPPEAVAQVRAFAERRLSAEEFEAYANAPMTDAECEEIESLINWFKRRYPTPVARLEFASRSYADWARFMPPSK